MLLGLILLAVQDGYEPLASKTRGKAKKDCLGYPPPRETLEVAYLALLERLRAVESIL